MAVRDPFLAPAAGHPLTAPDPVPGAPGGAALAVAQQTLGHSFANPRLLEEALTHRSAAHGRRALRPGGRRGIGSNERLEFIGDRVLGLLVAEWLLERYPDEQEGELGPRLATLVSRPVLAEIAGVAGLSAILAVAPNEARAGVKQLATVLSDAMEALIGALYLDGGLPAARAFVRKTWAMRVEAMAHPPKDPKTAVQEWLAAVGRPPPAYEVAEQVGPSHAPHFVIHARAGVTAGVGEGGSKRVAERLAAIDLLRKLRA